MKPIGKDEPLFLSKEQWCKVFTAMSVITILLYIVAMICSLCGSKYFILDYQNTQMDKIEDWFKSNHIYPLLMLLFNTIEFSIILSFVLKKITRIIYPIVFFALAVGITLLFPNSSMIISYFYPFLFYLTIPLIEQLIKNKNISLKEYGFTMIRLVIASLTTFLLQFIIFIIKSGNVSVENHIMNLSATFIYALEYDIALSVILFTISLFINREKGDSKLWVTGQVPGGSSQTSMKQLPKSLPRKNLTKTQINKIRWLYARFYLVQLGGFLLLMILPFLLGKVLEFLVMYLSFAIVRYLLGFKYSLHFKKETICITVGVLVFGILSLAVPFFYVVLIIAVSLGTALAILLHLSYKYQSLYLFNKMAKPDKFALLYTFFDGDITPRHVRKICAYKGLDDFQTEIIIQFTSGNKMSYIAFKHNYSLRNMIYKLDEAIEKLIK